jgi:hypothetical protein
MGALIATIFTVIAVAISSIFVSGQLATNQSVAPNAPSSKPAAAINCASGTFSCGSFCCANNTESCGSSSCVPRVTTTTTTSSSNNGNTSSTTSGSSVCDDTSSSVCRGVNVGDTVNCNHQTGHGLICTRTTGTKCSAIDYANLCYVITSTNTPTTTVTVTSTSTSTSCNVSLVSTSGCGGTAYNACPDTQVLQTWKTVTCGFTAKCVTSSSCENAVCTDGQYQCSGNTSVSCLNGQFNGIKEDCGTLGCNSTTGNCKSPATSTIAVTKSPVATVTSTSIVIITPASTEAPTVTKSPTVIPTVFCAQLNTSCSSVKPCCNTTNNVCESVNGGRFCVAKGTECTSNQTKCVDEAGKYYIYTCDSNGYYQKTKACDFGCSGNSCKTLCTPSKTQCGLNNTELQICTLDGTAWKGQTCSNGCQTVSGVSFCNTFPSVTKTTTPTPTLSPVTVTISTPTTASTIIPTITIQNSQSTCDGKPENTRECNNSGGYNLCQTGKWVSFPCSKNTTCSNGVCAIPSGCSCIDNIYVGTDCGHSIGIACSSSPKSCDNTSCAANCAQTAGYTGNCSGVDCLCSAIPTPTATLTPYCSWFRNLFCGSRGCTFTTSGGYCNSFISESSVTEPNSSSTTESAQPTFWQKLTSFFGFGGNPNSVTPSITPSATPTTAAATAYTTEKTQCSRNGGTWTGEECLYPYLTNNTGVTPTPTTVVLPTHSLDNYNHPGDSKIFATTTEEIANVLSNCQAMGNHAGISLRNCLCQSVDCTTTEGQALSDKIFSSSSDGNALQCVDFVASLETLQKNGTANNCSSNGASTASELVSCNEPGYNKIDRTTSSTTLQPGDIIVWSVGGNQCDRETNTGNCGSEGHVAICVEVSADGKSCKVAESNWNNDQTVTTDRVVSVSGTGEENPFDIIIRKPSGSTAE